MVFLARLQGGDLGHAFRGRHDQGAVHGARHRNRCLLGRLAGEGQRRVARAADHHLGCEIDLPGDRARRRFSPCSSRRSECDGWTRRARDIVIRVRDLVVGFGDAVVLDHLSLEVRRGEILGLVGGSGSGKSVLLAHDHRPPAQAPRARSRCWASTWTAAGEAERRAIGRRWGILFQHGALFSSLTVRQNVQFPMREYLDLSERLMDEVATAKLEMVGLTAAGCRQAAVGTFRRHDKARGARPRARARPGDRFPRRADLGARPDHRRRFRCPDPDAAARRSG